MATSNSMPLFCEVCQVALSGRIPAQQHYTSNGHKKKVENCKRASMGSNYCNVCNITCDTRKILEQHYQSPRHQATEQKQRASAHQYSQSKESSPSVENIAREYVFDGNRGYCYVCKIDLTSSSHAQSHLTGAKHLKRKTQVEMSQNVPQIATRESAVGKMEVADVGVKGGIKKGEEGSRYYQFCKLCEAPFSCPDNAKQHYSSEKHRKKEALSRLGKTGELLPLKCDICDAPFTGQESARAHFESAKHLRNVENKKIQDRANFGFSPSSAAQPVNEWGRPLSTSTRSSESSLNSPHNAGIGNMNISRSQHYEYQHLTKVKQAGREADSTTDQFPRELLNNGTEAYQPQSPRPVKMKVDMEMKKNDLKVFQREIGEEKIQEEIQSLSLFDTSLNSMTSSTYDDSFSNCNDPVRFIKNNLNSSPFPSFGRGRAFLELNALVEQQLSKNKERNLLSEETRPVDEMESDQFSDVKDGETDTKHLPIKSTHVNQSSISPWGNGRLNDMNAFNRVSEERIVGPRNNLTDHEKTWATQKNELFGSTRVGKEIPDLASQSTRSVKKDIRTEMPQEYTYDPVAMRGKCNVCNIDLTSFNHMTQHVNGKNHKKAALVWKYTNAGSEASQGSLVCDLCNVTLQGPEARDQHYQSEWHLQNERARGGEQSFFCEVCKIPCSGEISYQQHLMGAQHKKRAGLYDISANVALAMGADRTVWYRCDICGCSLNSSQQLAIHKKSHGSKTVQQTVGQSVVDKTTWYTCHICNCNLNSLAQLQIHEQSPSHLMNSQKTGYQSSPIQWSSAQHPEINTPSSFTHQSCSESGHMTPLQSFLAEELFPEEFMPKMEESEAESPVLKTEPKSNPPFNLVTSESPVPFQARFASGGERIEEGVADSETSGLGGAKRGQGSDLAWATRNRGTRDTNSGPMSSNYETHQVETNISSSGSDFRTMQAEGPSAQSCVVNPYAATHNYYCHTCRAPMNTQESYENHLRGKRHLQKVCTEPAPVREHKTPFKLPQDYVPKVLTLPRNYQMELYDRAMKQDSLCFLPTGTGKTLVSVLVMSAMLERYPSRNILFLVDKVLLVLQQAKYIKEQLQDKKFVRYNPDSEYMELGNRHIQVAAMCMGQQNTHGVPLWKHDIVVVTAAFCQNLLDKNILRWEDFSLVVFDEAHHCDKSHPFNSLLQTYHNQTPEDQHQPKILGLTASPAGKSDVPKTLQMLEGLIMNMGNVAMSVVEKPENVKTLGEFQSNAKMIIKSQDDADSGDDKTMTFRHELNVYLLQCYLKLRQVSDIQNYISPKGVTACMSLSDISRMAGTFVEDNFDVLQSSLTSLTSSVLEKVDFSLLTSHVSGVCMVLSSLMEGGTLAMLEEVVEMQSTQYNFNFAKRLGLPCDSLTRLIYDHSQEDQSAQRQVSDRHTDQLLAILTDRGGGDFDRSNSISLVLVKMRGTAHRLTRILKNNAELQRLGLHTATVVGHGGSGVTTDRGMSVNQQKRVLEEIKQFKYQIIIATSVAEEGVDWPECERVICMYPPTTVTALVQMRGRARRKNSLFIVLCASQQEEEKLTDIMNREQNMIKATQLLLERTRRQRES